MLCFLNIYHALAFFVFHQRCGFQAHPYIQFNGFPLGIPLRSVLIYIPGWRSGNILVHSPLHFQAGALGMVNGWMVHAFIQCICIYVYTHTHTFRYAHTYNQVKERIASIIVLFQRILDIPSGFQTYFWICFSSP